MGEERRGAPAKRPRVEDGVTTMLVLQAAVKQAAASAEAEPAPKMPPPQSDDSKFSTAPTTLDPSSCTVTDLSAHKLLHTQPELSDISRIPLVGELIPESTS